MSQKGGLFDSLAGRCSREYTFVSDYIWKTPRLIDVELKSEWEKLDSYFPLNGDPDHDAATLRMRQQRWSFESKSLTGVFPALMATANFLICVAILESYCLLLCTEIEQIVHVKLSDTKGVGRSRISRYLKNLGISLNSIDYSEQIEAAYRFRNCLIHFSGFLRWYDDAPKIRDIVSNRDYLSDEHRRTIDGSKYVLVQRSSGGDQLSVRNNYSHLLTAYSREYFLDLCGHANNVCLQIVGPQNECNP